MVAVGVTHSSEETYESRWSELANYSRAFVIVVKQRGYPFKSFKE